VLQAAASATIGRGVNDQDVQDFVNSYQTQERDYQTGSSPYLPSDPHAAATTFLTDRYPTDAAATRLGNALPNILCTLVNGPLARCNN
jgi:hypothetical protein